MQFLKEDRIYSSDYGTGNIINDQYFDISKNETSKYTDYLREPEKTNKYFKTTSSIKMLTPREYFDECAKIFNNTFEDQYQQIKNDSDIIDELKNVILKERKQFPITVLNYAENKQEGRHRMFTLGELFGWDKKYPVLIINETEEGAAYKTQNEILYGLNKLTNKALEFTYSDYNDFIDSLKYYLDDLSDYVEYKDLDIILTKKPSVIIQVDNVSYEIEEDEIDIDPNKEDDLEDLLTIDDLTDKEKEILGIK